MSISPFKSLFKRLLKKIHPDYFYEDTKLLMTNQVAINVLNDVIDKATIGPQQTESFFRNSKTPLKIEFYAKKSRKFKKMLKF